MRDDNPRLPVVRPPRLDLDADLEVVIARTMADIPDEERDPGWQVGAAGRQYLRFPR